MAGVVTKGGGEKIGELNGRWSALFKISTIITPFILSFAVFLVIGHFSQAAELKVSATVLAAIKDTLVDMKNTQATQTAKMNEVRDDVIAATSNRFTSKDGLAVWKEISDIRGEIAKIPAEIPPPLFKEQVDRHERELERLRGMIMDLQNAP